MRGKLLFALLATAVAFPSIGFAQESNRVMTEDAVVIANVAVSGGEVLGQEGNTVRVGFSVGNGGELVQPGVRYGVELLPLTDDPTKPVHVADIRVADETLTLAPGEAVEREFPAAFSEALSGVYRVSVTARTEKGLMLGRTDAGTVRLSGTMSDPIVLSGCSVRVGKEGMAYGEGDPIAVSPKGSMVLSCIADNRGAERSVTPRVEMSAFSYHSGIVAESDAAGIMVPAGVSQVDIPVIASPKPRTYATKVVLRDNRSEVSSPAFFTYTVEGLSAVFSNLRQDKADYAEGDTAIVSFAILGNGAEGANMKIFLTDADGKSCVDSNASGTSRIASKPFSLVGEVGLPIMRDCRGATLRASLTGEDGAMLDTVGGGTDSLLAPASGFMKPDYVKIGLISVAILASVIGVLIVGIAAFRRRNGGALLALLAIAGLSFTSGHVASGQTWFTIDDFGNTSIGASTGDVDISIDGIDNTSNTSNTGDVTVDIDGTDNTSNTSNTGDVTVDIDGTDNTSNTSNTGSSDTDIDGTDSTSNTSNTGDLDVDIDGTGNDVSASNTGDSSITVEGNDNDVNISGTGDVDTFVAGDGITFSASMTGDASVYVSSSIGCSAGICGMTLATNVYTPSGSVVNTAVISVSNLKESYAAGETLPADWEVEFQVPSGFTGASSERAGVGSSLTTLHSCSSLLCKSGTYSGSKIFIAPTSGTASQFCLQHSATFTTGTTGSLSSSLCQPFAVVPAPPRPTAVLSVYPSIIEVGESTTLTWSSTGADSCTASSFPVTAAWSGGKAATGSQTIVGLTRDTTFSIACSGPNGTSDTARRTVYVNTNVPPTVPVVGSDSPGMTGLPLPVTALSSDPDGDNIRYGFDWDMNGTVDEWAPAAGYAYSGTTVATQHVWNVAGDHTFQVLAEDANGAQSAWTQHTVTVSTSVATICVNGTPFVNSAEATKSLALIEGDSRMLRAFVGDPGQCSGTDVTNLLVDEAGDAVTLSADGISKRLDTDVPGSESLGRQTAQEIVSVDSDGKYAAIRVIVDELCVSRCTQEADQHCAGEEFESRDSCGMTETCADGTRSCDFNWKETAPGE